MNIKPKFKHGDKVWWVRDGKISEETIKGYVNFLGSIKTNGDIFISYTYFLSGFIAGTRFSEDSLFSTKEEAQLQLLKEADDTKSN